MKSKISIAMATYNGEKYLKEQLESIYSQTMLPDEVIVTDDCSTDETVSILEDYKQSHGLKYYVNEENVGYNKNFEKALRLCNGDYIAIADQDDFWMDNKLEVSVSKLVEIENNSPSMVSTNKYTTDSNLNVISYKDNSDLYNYYDAFFGPPSQGSTIVMNRKLLNVVLPLPNKDDCIYDAYIALVAAMCGNKYYIGEKLIKHRLHDNNSFHLQKERKTKLFNVYNLFYKDRFLELLPYGRYEIMKVAEEKAGIFFIENRKILFDKILEIYETKSLINSLSLVYSIKELPFNRRLKVIINANIHKFIYFINKVINVV